MRRLSHCGAFLSEDFAHKTLYYLGHWSGLDEERQIHPACCRAGRAGLNEVFAPRTNLAGLLMANGVWETPSVTNTPCPRRNADATRCLPIVSALAAAEGGDNATADTLLD